MFVPKTSHPRGTPLREYRIGKGDYVIGGSWTMPFAGLDGALRRRPVVFGEVFLHGSPSGCSVFEGFDDDPVMMSMMWRDHGVDGLCLRISEGDGQIVSAIAESTAMPVMVTGPSSAVEQASVAVTESTLILAPNDGGCVDPGCHLTIGEHLDMFPPTILGPGLRDAMNEGLRLRSEALSSSEPGKPTICDVTSVWDSMDGSDDVRYMTMLESQAALAAMLAGADIVIMRGPAAVDTAIGYGEELADL